MPAGCCIFIFFCNDTAGIEYDSFLRLMGGDTQGVSVGDAVHQRSEKLRSSQIRVPALRDRAVFMLSLCARARVCVCQAFLWLLSRFSSGISVWSNYPQNLQIMGSGLNLDKAMSGHVCWNDFLLLNIEPEYFLETKMYL